MFQLDHIMGKKVVIVDYQLGNLFSVNQALINVGVPVIVSSDKEVILGADALVLPGVGAFGDAMDNLRNLDLLDALNQKVLIEKKPLMGICLGLQLLFSSSEEFGTSEGLNFIKGVVKKFANTDADGSKVRVPQIAWNTINESNPGKWIESPLGDVKDGSDMYFVHSFYVEPKDNNVILSKTNYGGNDYCSSILEKNIFACQFHPEKSATEGLKIYKKWSELNKLY